MPIPVSDLYTPEFQRLLLLVESNLHFIVRQPLSREQALDIKGRLSRPLGILNSQNGLRSEGAAKNTVRRAQYGPANNSVDTTQSTD